MLQVSTSLPSVVVTATGAALPGAAPGGFSLALAGAPGAETGSLLGLAAPAPVSPVRQDSAEPGNILPATAAFLPEDLVLIRNDQALPVDVEAPAEASTEALIESGAATSNRVAAVRAALSPASAGDVATLADTAPGLHRQIGRHGSAGKQASDEDLSERRDESQQLSPLAATPGFIVLPNAQPVRLSAESGGAIVTDASGAAQAAALVATAAVPARADQSAQATALSDATEPVIATLSPAPSASPSALAASATPPFPAARLPADPRIGTLHPGQIAQAEVPVVNGPPAANLVAGAAGDTATSRALPHLPAVQPDRVEAQLSLIGIAQPAARAFAAGIAAASVRPLREDDTPPIFVAAAGSAPIATTPVADVRIDRAPLDMRDENWTRALLDRIDAVRDAADARDSRIRLVPDALGRIDVALRQQGDTLHVHFTADVAATRSLLVEAQPQLAELAEARGLKLGQSAVDGGQGQESRRQPQPATAPLSARRRDSSITHGPVDTDQRIA